MVPSSLEQPLRNPCLHAADCPTVMTVSCIALGLLVDNVLLISLGSSASFWMSHIVLQC